MRPVSRLARLRAALSARGLDALLVSSPAGIRYLCGFTGSHGLLVVSHASAVFLTDARYAGQARAEVPRGIRRVVTAGSLLAAAGEQKLLGGHRRAGFEDMEMPVQAHRLLGRAFPRVRFRGVGPLLEELAAVKEPEEIAAIAAAARISDSVFSALLPLIRVGVTELDIAAEISYRHRKLGAEGDAFDPLVASGARSAFPHARASGARFRRGDIVILDFGCVVRGYGADLTRTVALGRIPQQLRHAYRVVYEAQDAALEAVQAGVSGSAVDAAARNLISREGYGRCFPHALGHGLGLRLHERPRLAPLSIDVLQPGHVTAIEPGIYLPGLGGVRLEDDVVVRPRGCEALTTSPKELLIL